jgi:hypothetical protein
MVHWDALAQSRLEATSHASELPLYDFDTHFGSTVALAVIRLGLFFTERLELVIG